MLEFDAAREDGALALTTETPRQGHTMSSGSESSRESRCLESSTNDRYDEMSFLPFGRVCEEGNQLGEP